MEHSNREVGIHFIIKRPNGDIVDMINPKLFTMTDKLFQSLKEAYRKSDKGELLEVIEVKLGCKLNPKWIKYNNIMNEGGEGYNPHNKYIATENKITIYKG